MDKKTIVLNYEQTQIVESENEKYKRIKFYSVITEENEEIYLVSEDRKDLILDVKKALAYAPRRRPLRHFQYDEVQAMRSEHIHIHLEMNVPDFYDKVESLIFHDASSSENDILTLDAGRLLAVFPKLTTVCCKENIIIENAPAILRVLDPFALGEYSFELARANDIDEANRYTGMLWALSGKWARFWREVARDYNRKPEDHPKFDPNGPMVYSGMDDLFKVYLLGWYPKGLPIEVDLKKVYVEKHKNFKKAIELLPVRFQNCDLHEIGEKFFWDLQYVETEENPDYEGLANVILAAEKIIPNVRQGFFEAVQYYGCEESPSFLALKRLLEGSKTKG
jgi:hypothetical protein